jgi:ATP-dependent RNA helicase RhlE
MDSRPHPDHLRGGHEEKKHHKTEASGFAALGLRPELLRAVERQGWISPSPIQQECIPQVLAGHDLIGLAQTGTGKTGAFVLPLLQLLSAMPPARPLHPYCVILAPTRELVQQIDGQIKLLAAGSRIRSMTIFGGVSDRPQISQLNAGVEIVSAAPGRLLDLLGQGWVHFENVTHCVLDEADRMFDMGFIIDLKRILNRMPSRRQTLLFSATMPAEIQGLTHEFLYKPREVKMGATAPPAELSHEVWEIYPEQKNIAIDALLKEDYESVLIFTRTKHRADSVARRLQRSGEDVAVLHSNRSQSQRDAALARFKGGHARVLVATDVASRGLDIEGIGLVVNYDTPRDPDDYVHRVGRTARAKRKGMAVTLLTMDEIKYIRKIEQLIKTRIARRDQKLPNVEPGGEDDFARRPRTETYSARRESGRTQPREGAEPKREPRAARSAEAGRSAPRSSEAGSGAAQPRRSAAPRPARSPQRPAAQAAGAAPSRPDGGGGRGRGGRGRGGGAGRGKVDDSYVD